MNGLKGLVSGKVQGVWYRKSVQQGCLSIGLKGFAKNLPDGRVEVLLIGYPEQIEQGKGVVSRGSPHSVVTGVEWAEIEQPPEVEGFRVM